jgi:acetylornithine deacetylase/succinyl-diaminopimelate desuccinylase-like protein
MAGITVRTAARDLHSGIYGGSVLNALHVLQGMLAEVLPDPDGLVREELRRGIEPPAPTELESWQLLKPGDEVIAEVGGHAVSPDAGQDYYRRNGADASLEVNEIVGGEPRTLVPATARATISLRLAPRQRSEEMQAELERLMRSALPDGAEVDFTWQLSEPALSDPDSSPIRLAVAALERATGMKTAVVRSGGSIPAVAELMGRGIPTIVSGFTLPDDAFHAPNESYRVESLQLGERAARELYRSLAALPQSAEPAQDPAH